MSTPTEGAELNRRLQNEFNAVWHSYRQPLDDVSPVDFVRRLQDVGIKLTMESVAVSPRAERTKWSISDVKTTEGETMIVGGEGQGFGLIATVTDEADARQIIADRDARDLAPAASRSSQAARAAFPMPYDSVQDEDENQANSKASACREAFIAGAKWDSEHTASIATEIYKAFETFGAKSDLLSIVGSYGDTMTDADVLDGLKSWNEQPQRSAAVSAEPVTREKLIRAIRTYCLTVSPAAVQNSHGEDRIYYSGLLISGLADFILAANAARTPSPEAGAVHICGCGPECEDKGHGNCRYAAEQFPNPISERLRNERGGATWFDLNTGARQGSAYDLAANEIDRLAALASSAPVEAASGEPVTVNEADGLAKQLIDGSLRQGVDAYSATLMLHASGLIDRLTAASPLAGSEMLADEPCFYCGEVTNSLAGNPSYWPLRFCQPDGTGISRTHHMHCVTDRLRASAAVGGLASCGQEANGWHDISTAPKDGTRFIYHNGQTIDPIIGLCRWATFPEDDYEEFWDYERDAEASPALWMPELPLPRHQRVAETESRT